MERIDITNVVSKVEICSGISSKTGKEYSFINIKFVGDPEFETAVFPSNRDAMFIIKNVIVKE